MSIDPITSGIDLITSIISRVWPDKTEQEKAELQVALQEDTNLTAILTHQADIDANEAQSDNLFISGWRPSIGWVCSLSFAWQFVIQPILLFIASATNHPITLPTFDLSTMSTVLFGMLGLSGMRTYEKVQKVNKK
jgi:hypothetical protein